MPLSLASAKPVVRRNFWPAIISIALAGSIIYDRRAPYEYISTDIEPQPAHAGDMVTVRRQGMWLRRCEGEGDVWREIVKTNKAVVSYDRGYTRIPYDLGYQEAESRFRLDPMAPGHAKFRGRLMFWRCGLTSRIWPIEIPFQEVEFEVR